MWSVTPDLWFELLADTFHLEAELAFHFGNVGEPSISDVDDVGALADDPEDAAGDVVGGTRAVGAHLGRDDRCAGRNAGAAEAVVAGGGGDRGDRVAMFELAGGAAGEVGVSVPGMTEQREGRREKGEGERSRGGSARCAAIGLLSLLSSPFSLLPSPPRLIPIELCHMPG
jgi:hypothetical protein